MLLRAQGTLSRSRVSGRSPGRREYHRQESSPGNLLFLIALIWQRIATARTLHAYEEIGAAPVDE